MDVHRDTWEWVPHRVLKERWNAMNPDDKVVIDEQDYDKGGWFIECCGKKKIDYGKWFRERTVEKQIERLGEEEEGRVINNTRRLIYLKRKYTSLKIATWVFRRWRPPPPVEEDTEEDLPEPVLTTPEEIETANQLRAINRGKRNALLEKHRGAVNKLKRKRKKMEVEANYVYNSGGSKWKQSGRIEID